MSGNGVVNTPLHKRDCDRGAGTNLSYMRSKPAAESGYWQSATAD